MIKFGKNFLVQHYDNTINKAPAVGVIANVFGDKVYFDHGSSRECYSFEDIMQVEDYTDSTEDFRMIEITIRRKYAPEQLITLYLTMKNNNQVISLSKAIVDMINYNRRTTILK
jgi:hypothetical protein